jgi:hypothetical protein
LPPGHLLYGLPVSTFATRRGTDDVLFRHRDDPSRFTVVHLSWLGRTEINAQHPTVEFDGTFQEFLEEEARITQFLQELAKQRNASSGTSSDDGTARENIP